MRRARALVRGVRASKLIGSLPGTRRAHLGFADLAHAAKNARGGAVAHDPGNIRVLDGGHAEEILPHPRTGEQTLRLTVR